MRLGALSVITAGLSMMPMLSVNNWDSLILVNNIMISVSVKE